MGRALTASRWGGQGCAGGGVGPCARACATPPARGLLARAEGTLLVTAALPIAFPPAPVFTHIHAPSTRTHLRAQPPQMLDFKAVSSRRRLVQTLSVDAVLKVCSGVGGRLEGAESRYAPGGVLPVGRGSRHVVVSVGSL